MARTKTLRRQRAFDNPYSPEDLGWLKGNLHTHTTVSDGNLSPQQSVDAYAALGYDFLMLTDHDTVTDTAELDARGMTLIPGCEVTAGGPHILHLNATARVKPAPDRQRVINEITAAGGLAIMNHPNWEPHYNHCPQSVLYALKGYAGIEIYNGVTRRVEGNPEATDRWDMLLSNDKIVWGFGGDDNHQDADRGVVWVMVQGQDRSVAGIVDALKRGAFYVSTGVVIDSIRLDGRRLMIEAANAEMFHVCSNYGRVVARVPGPSLDFTPPSFFPATYFRVEAYGHGDAKAWIQPFVLHIR
ncbi:MAG TPA: CehA/McbA family metallohydrolase [Candidatus Hydrogenedentes bacterium]|nr:CehA/McbA family metallohydrolase [Candidatus Hydrogenedentota bacterium]